MADDGRNDLLLKIGSIMAAMLIWIYINAGTVSTTEKAFSIKPEITGLSQEMVVVGDIPAISIRIAGDADKIEEIREEDIEVSADLSGAFLGYGSYDYSVVLPEKTSLVSAKPEKISFTLDSTMEKTFEVEVALIGQTAHGYSSFKAVSTPSHVVVSGPSSMVEAIVNARVGVNLNNSSSNIAVEKPVDLHDYGGQIISGDMLSVNPAAVQVFVPVVDDTPSKIVPVELVTTGVPAEGFEMTRVVVEPETIKILGNYNSLSEISSIKTKPVSIEGADGTLTREAELNIPADVSSLYMANVRAVIQFEEKVFDRKISAQLDKSNLDEGKAVAFSEDTVTVTLQGSRTAVNDFSPEEFRAFVQLEGLENGEHELEIKIAGMQGLITKEIVPAKVTVSISDAAGENEEPSEQEGER